MVKISPVNIRMWSKLGSRGTFGVAIAEMAKEAGDNLMVLTSDLCITSGLDRFKKAYPERFLNVGIAEQNMINIAAGLAKEGFNVYATTFANFAAMRGYEQIRLSLGYMGYPVKIVGLASGLAMGMFGNTHYGIEDVSLMRAIPNLTVISPADGLEIVKTVFATYQYEKPVYIRLTGAMNLPIVYNEDYDFTIGKAVMLRQGTDIAIIAAGTMVSESLKAAEILAKEGIDCCVINMHTIKPLDTNAIDDVLKRHVKLIVTVEEHSVVGGLGGAIAEYTARNKRKGPVQLFLGLPDQFGNAGEYKYLLQKYGLVSEQIAQRISLEYQKED